MDQRPNILFITADQHRADCLGIAGRNIKTPHLDDLARTGTMFDLCICPSVVCQPARASILTGRMPLSHGVHDNGIDLDPHKGQAGFGGSLAKSGYRTEFIGKAHFASYFTFAPTGTPECMESSVDYPPNWRGPYHGFDHVEMMLVGHNWWPPAKPPRGLHYENWYHADGRGDERTALYWSKAGPDAGAAQTWHSSLPVAWHNSTWIADRTIAALQRNVAQPFCLWASFPDPHHPFDAPEPWSRLHPPESVDLPAHRERNFANRPWWHRAVLEAEPSGTAKTIEIRKNYSRISQQSDAQLRALIANYYGMISLIDHNIGRILIALQELGLADNTYVVYAADHGEWLGDHGLVLKGPMHYDGLLRVPLIMRGPGIQAGRRIACPVSTVDLAPTFLDWAGLKPLPSMDGRSLSGVTCGRDTRDHALNEWWLLPARAGVELKLFTVRTERHRMTVDVISGAGELYDLLADPAETTNFFDDPGCRTVRAELTALLQPRIAALPENPSVQVGTA